MNDITAYKGNSTGWITVEITDSGGNGISYDGYVVRVYAKRHKGDSFGDAVVSINSDDNAGQFDLTLHADGKYLFFFKPDNLDVLPNDYAWFIEFESVALEKMFTYPNPEDNAKLVIHPN